MTEVTTLNINPSNLQAMAQTALSEIGVFGFDLGDDPASEVTLKSCIFPGSQLVLHAYTSTGHQFSIAHLPFFWVDVLFEGQLERSLHSDALSVGANAVVLGHPGPMNIRLIEDPETRRSRGISCFVSPVAAERLLAENGLSLNEFSGQIVTDESFAAAKSTRALLAYAHAEFFERGVAHVAPDRARLFESLLSNHIAELFELYGYATPFERSLPSSIHLVLACEQIIKSKFSDGISIADVANELNVNPRTLQRAFKKHRGISPSKFLSTIRLEAARSRLLRPRRYDTVASIAYASGNSHLGRFSSRYKSTYGETPQETLSAAVGLDF